MKQQIPSNEFIDGTKDLIERGLKEVKQYLTKMFSDYALTEYACHRLRNEIKDIASELPNVSSEFYVNFPEFFNKDVWINNKDKNLDFLKNTESLNLSKNDIVIALMSICNISYNDFKEYESYLPEEVKTYFYSMIPEKYFSRDSSNKVIVPFEISDEFIDKYFASGMELSNETIEKYVFTKGLSFKNVLIILHKCNNYEYILKTLSETSKTSIKYGGTLNDVVCSITDKFPNGRIIDLFKILDKMAPITISYKVVTHVAKTAMDLSEDSKNELRPYFIKSGAKI